MPRLAQPRHRYPLAHLGWRYLAPGGFLHAVDLTGPAQHRLPRRRSHPNHRHDGPDLAALIGTADLADARETGYGSHPLGAYTFYRADR